MQKFSITRIYDERINLKKRLANKEILKTDANFFKVKYEDSENKKFMGIEIYKN